MTPVLFPELAEPEVARAKPPAPRSVAAAGGVRREFASRQLGEASVSTGRACDGLVRRGEDEHEGHVDGAVTSRCDWSASPYRGGDATWGECGAHLRQTPPRERRKAIGADTGLVGALRRAVRSRVKPGEHIAFGLVADPYPRLETRERVTFRALSALLDARDLRISVTTRSTLVARDAKLLGLLAQRHAVHVNVVVPTPDPRLARFLEPDAPTPQERLGALHALRRHGVDAGVFLTPLLPGVTDADSDLNALCAEAAGVGARWLGARLVVPDEPECARLLHALRRAYPRVAARFAWWTRYSDGNPGSGTERRPSRRRKPGSDGALARETGSGRDRIQPDSAGTNTLGRVHHFAARYGLAVRPGLALPTPQRSRQTTFAFPVAAASG